MLNVDQKYTYLCFVKILSFILIFYILLISSHPCCDEGDRVYTNLTEQGVGDSNDDCPDLCSPFFTCGSCSGFSNPDHLSLIDPKLVLLDEEKLLFSSPFDFDYINNIWRPPKIN